MSNIWDTLGLEEPTADIKAIKRAYAKKLRITRPDDDPEGFMALREALEYAMSHARYYEDKEPITQHKQGVTIAPDIIEDMNLSATQENIDQDEDIEIAAPEVAPITVDSTEASLPQDDTPSVMDDVIKLLKDPFARSDIHHWTTLFDDSRLEGIDESLDFEDAFRTYLLDHLGYFDGETELHNMNRTPRLLSPRVGNHIFKKMGWRDVQGRPYYIQDQIDWLRRDLDVVKRSSTPKTVTGNQHINVIEETDDGPSAWKIAIGLIVIVNIVRLLLEAGAGF